MPILPWYPIGLALKLQFVANHHRGW